MTINALFLLKILGSYSDIKYKLLKGGLIHGRMYFIKGLPIF